MKGLITLCILACLLSSCATFTGGPITEHQMKQLRHEEPAKLREGYVVLDIIFGFILPGLYIDFNTGAIYKPKPQTK